MPTIPKYIKCLTLGCKNPKAKYGGHCIGHGGRDTFKLIQTEQRKDFNSMYQTPMWKSVRAGQLSKQPLCQSCLVLGHIRSANHVDHLFPWSAISKTAFYLNIFQSLCHECHGNKSGLEKRGICRYYHNQTHTDFGVRDYQRVIDQYIKGQPIVA